MVEFVIPDPATIPPFVSQFKIESVTSLGVVIDEARLKKADGKWKVIHEENGRVVYEETYNNRGEALNDLNELYGEFLASIVEGKSRIIKVTSTQIPRGAFPPQIVRVNSPIYVRRHRRQR